MKLITGAVIRAARGLLRWSAEDLAERAKLGVATVRRAEQTDGRPAITDANCHALQSALEGAGIEFTNGGQPGLRFDPRTAALVAVQAYVLAHSDKYVRDRSSPDGPAFDVSRQMDIRDEANTLRKAKSYKDVEESLTTLREFGFVLPQEMAERLEAVFEDHARPTRPIDGVVPPSEATIHKDSGSGK